MNYAFASLAFKRFLTINLRYIFPALFVQLKSPVNKHFGSVTTSRNTFLCFSSSLFALAVQSFPEYFSERVSGDSSVVPSLISTLAQLGTRGAEAAQVVITHAEPVVRESARQWRYAVDHHIAPSVAAVGRSAADGLSVGVGYLAEAVLGKERKERVDETFDALSTIAEAVVGSDEEASDEPEAYDYPSAFMEPPQSSRYRYADYDAPSFDSSFHYQQLDPHGYAERIEYPPVLEAQESIIEPHYQRPYPSGVVSPALTVDPRNENYYQTNFNPSYSSSTNTDSQSVEEALYVLGKNLLGANVTDRLFPVAKQMAVGFGQVGDGLATISDALPPLPTVEFDQTGVRLRTAENPIRPSQVSTGFRGERNAQSGGRITTGAPRCTTPKSGQGRCMDIQNCPLLLADLDLLRKSICFKSLFVPGVCCPDSG